ncbi:hypothetical protein D3C75_668590 [compost metagenome]
MLPEHGARIGIVIILQHTVGIILLDAIGLKSGAVGVQLADIEAVTVNNIAAGQGITQGAVPVQNEADIRNLVPAVAVHIGNAHLMAVRRILRAAQPFPLHAQIGAAPPVRADHTVEGFVRIAVFGEHHNAGGCSIQIPDAQLSGQGTGSNVVIRQGGIIFQLAGHAVQNGQPLFGIAAVGPNGAVAEGNTIGDLEHNLGFSIAIQIINRNPVPHAHADGGGAGGDIVLVGAVRPQIHRPQECAVPLISLQTLRGSRTVHKKVILMIPVKIADPHIFNLRTCTQGNRNHRLIRMIGRKGEGGAGSLFRAADYGFYIIGIGLGKIGGGIGVIGSSGENQAVQFQCRAPCRRTVHVEADSR